MLLPVPLFFFTPSFVAFLGCLYAGLVVPALNSIKVRVQSTELPYRTGEQIAHTPGQASEPIFSKICRKGLGHIKQKWWLWKISSMCLHRRVARRIQYAALVFDKKILRGGVLSFHTCDGVIRCAISSRVVYRVYVILSHVF